MVIIRSASIWMFASTVLADCLTMGCRLSKRMLFASDCMENTMITQHMTTTVRMLRMVLLSILLLRVFLIFLPEGRPACVSGIFRSPFLIFLYVNTK